MRTVVAITSAVPIAITTHAQSGVSGCIAGGGVGGGGGDASVWRLKVADQSLGAGSKAITRQK